MHQNTTIYSNISSSHASFCIIFLFDLCLLSFLRWNMFKTPWKPAQREAWVEHSTLKHAVFFFYIYTTNLAVLDKLVKKVLRSIVCVINHITLPTSQVLFVIWA